MSKRQIRKRQIRCLLDAIVVERLFGQDPWPADRKTCDALNRRLIELGLEEEICDEPNTWKNTALGNELDVDLVGVFMGLWDEGDAVFVLQTYGLIDEAECETLYHLLESSADFALIFRHRVQRAYFDYSGKRGPGASPRRR